MKWLLSDEQIPPHRRKAKQNIRDIDVYLRDEAGTQVALSVVRKIREGFALLGRTPGAGHIREGLTSEAIKFWPVYSYLFLSDRLRPNAASDPNSSHPARSA